jgi:hypothetical protein
LESYKKIHLSQFTIKIECNEHHGIPNLWLKQTIKTKQSLNKSFLFSEFHFASIKKQHQIYMYGMVSLFLNINQVDKKIIYPESGPRYIVFLPWKG